MSVSLQNKTLDFVQSPEDIFNLMSAAVNDALAVLDIGNNIVFWNEHSEKYFKYKQEEITGKNFLRTLISNKYHQTILKNIDRPEPGAYISDAKTIYAEAIAKDHAKIYCKISLSVMKIKEQLYTILYFRDATDYKLKKNLLTLKKSMEFVKIGVCVTDMEGVIVTTNSALAQVHGLNISDLTEKKARDVLPCLSHIKSMDEFKNYSAERLCKNNASGKDMYVKIESEIVLDDDKSPIAVIITFEDITNSKNMQLQICQYNEHLESLVKERTQTLSETNKQLRDEIVKRTEMEEQIRGNVKDLNMLLKEVHHRVKNNLQIIVSLLSLQSATISDPLLHDIFKDSETRIRAMALIHEKLYESTDMSTLDFGEYLHSLASELLSSYSLRHGGIELKTDIGVHSLDIDIAIPCGLVINEFITNSLKYAFPGNSGGQIKVSFHRGQDDKLYLTLSDNGVGLSKDIDIKKVKSLGLQLIHDLIVRKLKGTIEINTDGGTEFKIII
ncbi:MAG: PAS domain S-box protein [Nitrospirae bacterium]|nr:PAS domain S-box protein [Nitrospirota bacterium]MBF0535548.1 PAS domain S-box protein [Nitrospirota bacterium]MBF0617425.1 PAS domain S-box protein [Nitrospirota bacterium]